MPYSFREKVRLWLCRTFGHTKHKSIEPWEFNGKTHNTCGRCLHTHSTPTTD